MKKIKLFSTFTGIGGWEKAMQLADVDFEVVGFSEINKPSVDAYLSNFPESIGKNLGDITKINEKDVPDHDIFICSPPCQAFSVAGLKKGFDDTRGTLFFDVARIAQYKKSKYLLMENVDNLVKHDNGNTLDVIIKTLSDIGYSVDFTVINSEETGIPQSRSRFYLIGILDHHTEKYSYDYRNEYINNLKLQYNFDGNIRSFNFFNKIKYNKDEIYIKDIIDYDVDEKYYLTRDGMIEFIDSLDKDKIDNCPINHKMHLMCVLPHSIYPTYDCCKRIYNINGICPTITKSQHPKIIIKENDNYRIRSLTEKECILGMGYDEKFYDNIVNAGVAKTQIYGCAGNSVVPQVIQCFFELLKQEYL